MAEKKKYYKHHNANGFPQGLLYDKIAADAGCNSLVAIFQSIMKTVFKLDLNLWFVLNRGSKSSSVSDALKCPTLLGMKTRVPLDTGIYHHFINKPLYSKTRMNIEKKFVNITFKQKTNEFFPGIASNFIRAVVKLHEFVNKGTTAEHVNEWSTETLWKNALGQARIRTRKSHCRKLNVGTPRRPPKPKPKPQSLNVEMGETCEEDDPETQEPDGEEATRTTSVPPETMDNELNLDDL